MVAAGIVVNLGAATVAVARDDIPAVGSVTFNIILEVFLVGQFDTGAGGAEGASAPAAGGGFLFACRAQEVVVGGARSQFVDGVVGLAGSEGAGVVASQAVDGVDNEFVA